MIYDVIIIGAGAAGLFCSSSFGCKSGNAESIEVRPLRGLILEKGKHPGRKLLMSGNGQCNITHAGSVKDFVGCYGDSGRLLRNCLYKYSNLSLMEFLESGGVKTVIRDDGKVFPASMDARDVLNLLLHKTTENGFEIRYESAVGGIEEAPNHLWRVHTISETYMTRALVIATGGCSYPTTGSDGTMFHVLERDLGVAVTPLKPALSSLQVMNYPYVELSGISFESANVSIWRDGRRIAENTGALLFTHHDLSGPAILNISKFAEAGNVLKINYVYPLGYDGVLGKLKAATHGSKSGLAGIIASEFHMPMRFCKVLTEQCGESLKTWARLLTGQEMVVASVSGFDKAMATSGGIELSQVDMATMELKEHCGLYVIGEALDVDGITGGYNLQFAYSSGRTASSSIFLHF